MAIAVRLGEIKMNQIIAGLIILSIPLTLAGFTGLGIITICLLDTEIKPRIKSILKKVVDK